MTLKEIRMKFKEPLEPLYGADETDSFFRLLLEFRHGMKRVDFALDPEKQIAADDVIFWNEAKDALLRQQPIQYIIGETTFLGRRFFVDSSVLIPRPETEELVNWIVTEAHPEARILDIGTGSGAIAVSLALEIALARVTALDVSSAALETARKNAEANKAKVAFRETDILTATHVGSFDIIVSNPPYVRLSEKEMMKDNVLVHEPHLALFVGDDDPLLFYRKITDLAKNALAPGGRLYFEINQYLGEETVQILEAAGFTDIELRKDIYGNDRMLRGVQPYS